MTNAWEGANLTHNLGVLASLARSPVGTKLKFDPDSGRFAIDERDRLSRTFSRDSVTSGSHFVNPMGRLLLEAQEKIGTGGVTQELFGGALAGLAQLRRTYEGAPDKVRTLDKVLESVEGLAPMAREAGNRGRIVVRLRERYREYLVYAIRQRNYLDVNQGDVCHAFVIDWGRRILFGTGKASYADRQKYGTTFEAKTSLSLAEHARMQRKVNRVADLQEEERRRLARKEGLRTSFEGVQKFSRVWMTGGDSFECGGIERTHIGQDVFRAILKAAREFGGSLGERVMLVRLDGASEGGSHMLGLHLYGDDLKNVHLFDPNVGEFRFLRGAESTFWRFCNDLMANLYSDRRELLFNSWVIRRLYGNNLKLAEA
jgi:hypothetical protein